MRFMGINCFLFTYDHYHTQSLTIFQIYYNLPYTGTRPDLLFKPEFMSDEEFQDLVQLEGAGSTGSQ